MGVTVRSPVGLFSFELTHCGESVPDFVEVDDPRWAMHPGRMDYKANYTLINDNLLDLSYIGFLHANSLGLTVTPKKIFKPTVAPIACGCESKVGHQRTVKNIAAFPRAELRRLADL